MSKQVILVTGASSGFGLMTAKALAQAGHTVYASMRETAGRNAPQARPSRRMGAKPEGVDLRTVELDVQSDASAEAGVAHIIADAGRLDVHRPQCRPHGVRPGRSVHARQFIQQYDVNVLGAQRVNRAALPHLRGQRQGPAGLGRLLLDARRHAAFPGALFRGQGGDGCAGRVLLHRARAVGHRDHDHGAGRLHQGHQPLRALRASLPTRRGSRSTKLAPMPASPTRR